MLIQLSVYQEAMRLINFDPTMQGDVDAFGSTMFYKAKSQSTVISERAVSNATWYKGSCVRNVYRSHIFHLFKSPEKTY